MDSHSPDKADPPKKSNKRSKKSKNADGSQGTWADKAMKNIAGGTVKPNVEKLNIWKASHPIAALFHTVGKVVPPIGYMMMGMFSFTDTITFISCLIMLCLDFWVRIFVKN
jgi:hypothetical protein